MIDPELNRFLDTWDANGRELPAGATPQPTGALLRGDRARDAAADAGRMSTPTRFTIPAPPGRSACGCSATRRRHAAGLIYMHGGGWMQGSPETHWDITSRIAAWNRQTVISIDYALAPEHPFPAAINQCARSSTGRSTSERSASIRPHRHRRRQRRRQPGRRGLRCLRGTPCRSRPTADLSGGRFRPHAARPMNENANGPLLMVAGMPAVNALYCPNPGDRRNPLAAPLMAAGHAGLPPAFIAVAEYDPLRDGGWPMPRRCAPPAWR